MKIKKVLFLSLFLIIALLFMPNTVSAAEIFTKMEVKLSDPQAGVLIPDKVELKLSNDKTEISYDDVEINWEKYVPNEGYVSLEQEEISFKEDVKYRFNFADGALDMIETEGHEMADDGKIYVNESLVDDGYISKDFEFYIGGIETVEVLVNTPISGQTFPKTAKSIFITSTETKEFLVDIDCWIDGSSGNSIIDENEVAELGKFYTFSFDSNQEMNPYIEKIDLRTKILLNGVESYYISALDSNATFSITSNINNAVLTKNSTSIEPNAEYSDKIIASDGYKLPDTIAIQINGILLNSKYYSYNKETGEILIPAERVTGDIILTGEAIKIQYDVKYKIIFDPNGGTFASGKTLIEYDDVTECDISEVENPVKNGYTFKGWYTEKTGGESFETIMSSEDGIKQDTTFFAKWEDNSSIGDESNAKEEEDKVNDNKEDINTSNENEKNNEITKKDDSTIGQNPQTGDNIIYFLLLAIVSVLGLIITSKFNKYFKRK